MYRFLVLDPHLTGILILSNFFSHVLSPFLDLMVSNPLKAKTHLSGERKKKE
jgi:hypothetical protein